CTLYPIEYSPEWRNDFPSNQKYSSSLWFGARPDIAEDRLLYHVDSVRDHLSHERDVPDRFGPSSFCVVARENDGEDRHQLDGMVHGNNAGGRAAVCSLTADRLQDLSAGTQEQPRSPRLGSRRT